MDWNRETREIQPFTSIRVRVTAANSDVGLHLLHGLAALGGNLKDHLRSF